MWADSYIFGTPTRYGNASAQLKQFIDAQGPLWAEGKLADKAVGVFTSAGNEHGGQESTILSLYNVMAHWGSIVVPMGYTADEIFAAGGNPYGVSSSDGGDDGPSEEVLAAARYQGRRTKRLACRRTALLAFTAEFPKIDPPRQRGSVRESRCVGDGIS